MTSKQQHPLHWLIASKNVDRSLAARQQYLIVAARFLPSCAEKKVVAG
jgi:hypothetical protein